jgi:hypothetical protein
LTACQDKAIADLPPAERFACPDEPGRPAGSGAAYTLPDGTIVREVTDEDARDYMLALRASWHGCKTALDWLRIYYGIPAAD